MQVQPQATRVLTTRLFEAYHTSRTQLHASVAVVLIDADHTLKHNHVVLANLILELLIDVPVERRFDTVALVVQREDANAVSALGADKTEIMDQTRNQLRCFIGLE